MAAKSETTDYWRNYFRSANSDIFTIIEHAIVVAASDCPKEFKSRRDRIAEKLFSCKLTRCSACDHVELALPEGDEVDGCKTGLDGDVGSKVSKVNSNTDNQGAIKQASNYSYEEAEALTDVIEEENQNHQEVLRIKAILGNKENEVDSVLFESLRRLQWMSLNVDTLKATEIGITVNKLRKHASKEIRNLAKMLIELWKKEVDEWVKATTAIAEGTPDSVNPSVLDEEEGLPSPPFDEAFFSTNPGVMELSQFFDGMDDFGNPQSQGGNNRNHEDGRRRPSSLKPKPINEEKKVQQKQEAFLKPKPKPNKPSNADSEEPTRISRGNVQPRVTNNEMKSQLKIDKPVIISDERKMEAMKRKLHDLYEEHEKAKKQRTVQMVELQDLPKQGIGHRNPHMRPGMHKRNQTTKRR